MEVSENIFPPFPVDPQLSRLAASTNWPSHLVQRMLNAGYPSRRIEEWIRQGLDPGQASRWVEWREKLTFGTLQARIATSEDSDALVDLFNNSPEEIGDWQVIVERGPNPFAQLQLQDDAYFRLISDRGVALAASSVARIKTIVGGQKLTVRYVQAFRVRKGFRGKGLTRLLQTVGRPSFAEWTLGEFYYVRSNNNQSIEWLRHQGVREEKMAGEAPGTPVSVLRFPVADIQADYSRIRPARRSDIASCANLINSAHQGFDLFVPVTAASLRMRLRGNVWGRRPEWIRPVYSLSDYYVLEEDGAVVACAGLWDRGADVREVWKHVGTGDTRVIDPSAVLDSGFLPGREDALADVIQFFIAISSRLGKSHVLVSLQHLPLVAALLQQLSPEHETRGLQWHLVTPEGKPMHEPYPSISRPFVDLSYW
jgi:hypothetical protein